jgi:hypothetical protein
VDLGWALFYYISGYGYMKFGKGYLNLMDEVDSDELKTGELTLY